MDTIKATVIIGRDSLVSKFNEASGEYYVYMKEMDTDWTGVIIVCIVCATIMVIAGLIYRYFLRKNRKTLDKNKAANEGIDREWKQKVELADKLLCYLENKEKGKEDRFAKDEYKETLEYLLGKTACANRRVIAEREWERIVELENQLLSYVNEKKKKGIENENKGGDDEYKQKLEELLGKAESAIAENNKKNDKTT